MAQNRLFIYDPETKRAACIAKGYASGWLDGRGSSDHVNNFFNEAQEFTGDIESTRYQLKTELDLPDGTAIHWEDAGEN